MSRPFILMLATLSTTIFVSTRSLANVYFIKGSSDCPLCTGSSSSTLCQTLNLQEALNKSKAMLEDDLKSIDEANEYMYKYRKECNSKYFNRYANEYTVYIKEASKAFDLPEVLLSCILFKESHFDAEVQNKASGARGVAQITLGTAETISNIIEKTRINEKELEARRSEFARLSSKDSLSDNDKAKFARLKTDLSYLDLSQRWNQYFQGLSTNSVFTKNNARWIKEMHSDHKSPNRFSYSLGTRIPANAIGASALWLRYTIQALDEHYNFEIKNSEDYLNLILIAAGGYNMGVGGPLKVKLPGKNKGTDLADFVQAIEKNNLETGSYLKSIRRCIKKGEDGPPVEIDWKNKKLIDSNKVCKESEPAK